MLGLVLGLVVCFPLQLFQQSCLMLLKLLLSESLCLIPQEEQILIGSLSEESGDVLI